MIFHYCRSEGKLETIFSQTTTSNGAVSRYANCSARFMDAYTKGLTGPQAVWATRKYHRHRVVPNSILEALDTAGKI
ncbi:uncharacterized protein HD556DRAFT_1245020 [Suillus plorans]|uniref:Uncharacterized protein n=1 Tax=Suillus plorans TaxID=116603 RepID=A0A9P7AFW1_9AGAM|nr:uncharacterized protein HD556DRAFT_1245020 [Suillus plorans]KAG1788587.1 hypothetical protein HD556DRAFT_1245020 [Suillus plorans]